MHRFAVFILLLCFSAPAFCQQTDTLKEVKISTTRPLFQKYLNSKVAAGQKVITIDSTVLQQYKYQAIANLLAQQVPVFVKSYGFNSLATISFRGASSAQSAVLWNGIPIQNDALGVTDVSLLPVSLIDKVDIVYSSSAALLGSGNVGGAVLLENDLPVFDTLRRSLSVSIGGGSFSQYMAAINSGYSAKKWCFSLKAYGQSAKDNFTYTDLSGMSRTTPNASLYGGGAIGEMAYKIADKNTVSITAWYQYNNRDIPPALFEAYSVKNTAHSTLRTLLQWNKEVKGNKWYGKSSLITDLQEYHDPSIQLRSRSKTYQYYQEVGWQGVIGPSSKVTVFLPTEVSWMKLMPDTLTRSIIKTALAGAYEQRFLKESMIATIDARAEIVNGTSFVLPGIAVSYSLTRWLVLRGNAQRTYRVPTLNELYYIPGGNKDLKPEQGWAEDGGYRLKVKKGNITIRHDLSLFNRAIKDWILWFGGAIWTPHNIAMVNSRGVETENELLWHINSFLFHISLNTSYIRSFTTSSYIPGDGSVGKQIPYTPLYSGQANIGFTLGSLYVNYNHTYSGYRYITTDESEYLLPYQTGNAQLMYTANRLIHPVQILLQCNNIWNNHYAVVSYRPMPGINYVIGAKFAILR